MSPELEVLKQIAERLNEILDCLVVVVALMTFSACYRLATIFFFADPKEPKK